MEFWMVSKSFILASFIAANVLTHLVADGVVPASSFSKSLPQVNLNDSIFAPAPHNDFAPSVTFPPTPPELLIVCSPVDACFPADINLFASKAQKTLPSSAQETSPPLASSAAGSWMAFRRPPPAMEVVRDALIANTRDAYTKFKATANMRMIRQMVIESLELPEDYFNDLEWKHRSAIIIKKAFKEAWVSYL